MSTDVILADDGIAIQARVLTVQGTDLIIDSPDRRDPNHTDPNELRRAIVHDFNDGLTINYNDDQSGTRTGDYPGGVTINGGDGGVTVNGPLGVDSLHGNTINAVVCTTTDFMLDSPDRHQSADVNGYTPRRALVHDFNDGLTINYKDDVSATVNGDYPGGVTINGPVGIDSLYGNQINAVVCTSTDFVLDNPDRHQSDDVAAPTTRRALVHDYNDGLTINYLDDTSASKAGDYPGGVTINGNVLFTGNVTIEVQGKPSINFLQEIESLQSEVAALKAALAKLSK